jgi:hypothetical protein
VSCGRQGQTGVWRQPLPSSSLTRSQPPSPASSKTRNTQDAATKSDFFLPVSTSWRRVKEWVRAGSLPRQA